jgi:hypothetical protein
LAHPSAALTSFLDSIASAKRLAAIEDRYKDPPRKNMAPTVEALRGGFCVLVVGSFEQFLVESFQEHLAALEGDPPPVAFSALPERLRVNSVFESLEFAMKGPRYGAAGRKAGRFRDVAAAARRAVGENIDPAALAQTKGNPDAKRVAEMFKALGVKDPFGDTRAGFDGIWGKPEASSFVPDKLDEIVNARHVVAHTARALQIGRADLRVWPRFLESLGTVLDERLELYVTNVLARIRPP